MLGRRGNANMQAQIRRNAQIGDEASDDRFCTLAIIRNIIGPRHYLERLWWIVVLVSSIIGCVAAILSIWNTWTNRPVTVVFDDKVTPISEIPFPSVTVCTTQIFKDPIGNGSIFEDKDILEAFSQICSIQYENSSTSHDFSIYETIERISPCGNSVIQEFVWKGNYADSLFQPIFTKRGLCFIFNSLNSRDIFTDVIAPEFLTVRNNPDATHWKRDEGYRRNVNESELYPYRVFGFSDLRVALNIILDATFEYCRYATPGFTINFQMPDELQSFTKNHKYISADQIAAFNIKPKVTLTSDGLRYYAPHVRGCYFGSERRLRFFKSYNQANCQSECFGNFTKSECGCVQFYLPRDNSTKACRSSDTVCISNLTKKMFNERGMERCDCLPNCVSVEYEFQSEIVQRYRLRGNAQYGDQVQSVIAILFETPNFIAINRVATSTMSEFISNCGGLLGLFTGVSVLSIVELICFFFLRLGRRLRSNRVVPINARTWATRTRNPHPQRRLSI